MNRFVGKGTEPSLVLVPAASYSRKTMGKGLLSLRGPAIGIAAPSLAISALIGACSGFEGESENVQGVDASGGDAETSEFTDASVVGDTSAEASVTVSCGEAGACKRVFVTSTAFDGNLGGLAGANSKCVVAATNAGLGGAWTAWVSSGSVGIRARTEIAGSWYIGADEAIRIPEAGSDDIVVLHPLSLDERGQTIPPGDVVWTGTIPCPVVPAGSTCAAWSRVDMNGTYGDPTQTAATWSNAGKRSCSELAHLYCFEQ